MFDKSVRCSFFDIPGVHNISPSHPLHPECSGPALLLREWRTRYVYALDEANTGKYGSLINIIGTAVEGGLNLYLQAIEATAVNLVLLADLAHQFDLDVDYLGWLARRGRIEATKHGQRWYSTPQAIERYQQEAQEGKKQSKRQKREQ